MFYILSVVSLLVSVNLSTGVPTGNKDDLKISKLKYEDEIDILRKEIKSLQDRLTKLESTTGLLEADNDGISTDNDGTETKAHVLHKRATFRRRRRRPEIAFQSSLTTESQTYNLYEPIIFNHVLTNIGHAYNRDTGIFTVPLDGTYTFNTNIVAEKGNYVEVSIQVNDDVTVSAISDHRVSPGRQYFDIWDQGNAVAILGLKRGDKVSVSIQWPQGSHDIHGVGKSNFSGYLIRSHEPRRIHV